jgi:hypothetical protein
MYIPYRVRDTLMAVKGVVGIRVCFDADNRPFSFHAMSSEFKEIGYVIPDMGESFYPIVREWGYPATYTSTYVTLGENNE